MSRETTTLCDRCGARTSVLGRVGSGWLTGTIYQYGSTPSQIDLCPKCAKRAIQIDEELEAATMGGDSDE